MTDVQEKHPSAVADDAPVETSEGGTATMPRKGRATTMVLALLLLAGLGGWATWPRWEPHIPESVRTMAAPLLEFLPTIPSGNTKNSLVFTPESISPPSGTEKPVPVEQPVVAVTPPSPPPVEAPLASPEVDIQSPAARQETPTETPVAAPTEQPPAIPNAIQNQLETMEQALHQLQQQVAQQNSMVQRLDALEARDRLASGLMEQMDGLARQLDGLTRQMTQLQQNGATANSVLALAERVTRLEQTQAKAGLLLLSMVQLHSAVQAGRDFRVEWQSVQSLGDDQAGVTQALSVLEPYQQTGILPFGQLVQRFTALEPVAIRAGLLPEQDGWWRQTLDQLLGLVVVRREDGSQAGDGVSAFLGRASEALARHDLGQAVAEVEGIHDPAAAAVMAPWLQQARIRLQAESALSHLTASLLAAVRAVKDF